jgi:hypothetical protein
MPTLTAFQLYCGVYYHDYRINIKKSTPQKFCQKNGLSKQEISTLHLQYQKKASTLCCHTLLFTHFTC